MEVDKDLSILFTKNSVFLEFIVNTWKVSVSTIMLLTPSIVTLVINNQFRLISEHRYGRIRNLPTQYFLDVDGQVFLVFSMWVEEFLLKVNLKIEDKVLKWDNESRK